MVDLSAATVGQQIEELDQLIKKPIYSIAPDALARYEKEYFGQKCRQSYDMVQQAVKYIPGGVQHNLAFNHPFPLVFTKAEGAYLEDLDGNRYFDFLQAGGPTVLGSNPPEVREKVIHLLNTCGPSTGLFHEYEFHIAKLVTELIPSVNWLRLLNSGTEACMAAIRIARLATKKKHILKMGGAYHGWSDQHAYGIRVPGSKFTQAHGIPRFIFKGIDEFFPGDLKSLERKLRRNSLRGGTAAVMIEPVGPESGTRPISIDFVKGAAELCKKYGALLIFDEVVTAFRLSPHGAQGIMGIEPDLTVFGKVIGGGYPGAGGIGGKEEYRKYLAAGIQTGDKVKKALVGGTMAATPLSALAGYYTIKLIQETKACDQANAMGDRLTAGLKQLIKKHNLPFVAFNQGSICHLETVGTMHFVVNWKKPWTILKVLNETSARKAEMEHMGAAYMAEGLVTLAGSRLYTSAAYSEEMIDQALAAFDRAFANVVRLD
ncbi:MAG: aminotransferase class III-fold pyridoxal phosphate-dependent enzyme [Clostridiaceae bacterium]|nr:aminotransferase class III-fold pyridoxal phosphate-dependent enzyme [Clostridiaceae bacterium]